MSGLEVSLIAIWLTEEPIVFWWGGRSGRSHCILNSEADVYTLVDSFFYWPYCGNLEGRWREFQSLFVSSGRFILRSVECDFFLCKIKLEHFMFCCCCCCFLRVSWHAHSSKTLANVASIVSRTYGIRVWANNLFSYFKWKISPWSVSNASSSSQN